MENNLNRNTLPSLISNYHYFFLPLKSEVLTRCVREQHCVKSSWPTDRDPAVYLIVHHKQRKLQHTSIIYRKDKDKQREGKSKRMSLCADTSVRCLPTLAATLRPSLLETTDRPARDDYSRDIPSSYAAQPGHSPLLSNSQQAFTSKWVADQEVRVMYSLASPSVCLAGSSSL